MNRNSPSRRARCGWLARVISVCWKSDPASEPTAGRRTSRGRSARAARQRARQRERGWEALEPRMVMAANFVINEFMASNTNGLLDQDGDTSDWIEIQNTGNMSGSLNGYRLADDTAQWVFPNVTLNAGAFMVVFASGKDRRVAGQQLHTNFLLSAQGERLALIKPDQTVAQEFNPYPPQESNISYGLTQEATRLIGANSGLRLKVPAASDAGLGTSWTGTNFDAGSWQTSFDTPTASAVISEVAVGNEDFFEIQNVSGQTLNTSGWFVAINDNPSNINDVKAVFPLVGSSLAPGQVWYRTDNAADAANYFGADIGWNSSAPIEGWVMLLDNTGKVVDFVNWGWSAPELGSLNTIVNGYSITNATIAAAWSGLSRNNTGVSATNSLQRQGSADTNNGANWNWVATPTKGGQNASFTVPFAVNSTPIRTGIGFNSNPEGLAVKYFKANVAVTSLNTAEAVIADPSKQSFTATEVVSTINYVNVGSSANFAGDRPFPTQSVSTNVDDFVIEATGTVVIPVDGLYTFGVNSDDGFSLELSNGVDTFFMSFPNQRGPSNTLSTFKINTPGVYNMRLVYFERGGGAGLELFAAAGSQGAFNSSFKLIGDPAGAVAVTGFGGAVNSDIRSLMQGVNSSIWTRFEFGVADPAAFASLVLNMKYNDGFVAYLNGTEIARRNAPGGTPQWNSQAPLPRNDALASAFEAIDVSAFLSSLRPGINVLAIQGMNVNKDDGNFLLLPELLASEPGLSKRFFLTPTPGAANTSGLVDFVGDTQFSVKRGFFDAPFQVSIATSTLGAEIRYTLNGTTPTATSGNVYTGPITIDRTTTLRAAAFKTDYQPSNVDTQTYLFLADVIATPTSVPAGFPTGGVNGQVMNYGMDTRITNSPTWGPQMQSALKALPSLSLVTDSKNLFDPSTGIYVNAYGDGQFWERPTSLELINPDGSQGFQVDAGLRIRGGFSRSGDNPKHAFRLLFRSEYGDAKLRYPLFGAEGASEFDAMDLRTAQNYSWSFGGDSSNVMVEEVWNRDTMRDLGQAYTRSRWYHLYVNGHYWGLYQTEERPEASYGETYFGGVKEDYDVIKVQDGYVSGPTDGTFSAWTTFYNLANSVMNASTQAQKNAIYLQMQGLNPDGTRNPAYPVHLDVDNLIEYMQLIFYSGDRDAPISNFIGNTNPNNWYGIRSRSGQEGWRFISHDAEHTLSHGMPSRLGPWPAGAPNFNGVSYSTPQWIHQALMFCDEYRVRFADRTQENFFNGGAFTQAAALARFNARTAEIDTAIIAESARWGDSKTGTPLTKTNWLSASNATRSYFNNRANTVITQLRGARLYGTNALAPLYPSINGPAFSQFGGAVPNGFNLGITAAAGATIHYTLDGTDPRLFGGAVSPQAQTYSSTIPIVGPVVVSARARTASGEWSAVTQAEFFVNPLANANNLAITEVNYHPTEPTAAEKLINPLFVAEDFEFIELKNLSDTPIELSGVNFGVGIQFTMQTGAASLLGPGQYAVLVKNPTAFAARYGANAAVRGTYTGSLSNSGEQLLLRGANNATIDDFSYGDSDPWPGRADGQGSSLELIATTLNPALSSSWRSSSEYGGTPGRAGAGPVATIVINEVLSHTDLPFKDAVELYNPTGQDINVGGWYLTDSSVNYQKYRIPDNTVIAAGGYLVFDESNFNPNPQNPGPNDFAFSSAHGDDVYLVSATPNGQLLQFVDHVEFGAAINGESFGRWPNSSGDLYPMISRTFGAANSGPRIGPVIINEVMYNPLSQSDDLEYIELLNVTDAPVDLSGWSFTAGVSFAFPANLVLPPRGTLVVTRFNPAAPADAAKLAAFRAAYGIDASVPLVGGYAGFTGGVLDNGGETIRLSRPDLPSPEEPLFYPQLLVDEVDYDDVAPWPTSADGGGKALVRQSTSVYGNDPSNWVGGDPAPGAAATPLPASGLTAAPTAANRIRLTWLDNSANETGFKIERSTDGVSFVTLSTVAANETTFDDVGVGSYLPYTYRVRSYNLAGDAAASNAAGTSTTLTTITGTAGADTYHVLRSGDLLHVFENTSPIGAPTYYAPISQVPTLTINTLGGDDVVNVSAGAGTPLGTGLVLQAGEGLNILHVNSGSATIQAEATGSLESRVAAGASYTTSRLRQRGLFLLGEGATVRVSANGGLDGLAVLDELSIANGGNLDLNDNDLVLAYSASSPLVEVRQQILNGLSGAANLPRITSSVGAAATDTLHVAFDNSGVGASEWLGYPLVGTNQVIVKYTYFGDLNLDGAVDASDYLPIDNNFGAGTTVMTGDANLDGLVDAADYLQVDNNFGKGSAVPLAALESDSVVGREGMGLGLARISDQQVPMADVRTQEIGMALAEEDASGHVDIEALAWTWLTRGMAQENDEAEGPAVKRRRETWDAGLLAALAR